MNIVFLMRPWPVYGGGETVTLLLANELVKRNNEVHIIYTKDTPASIERPFIDSRIISCKVNNIVSDEHCYGFKRNEIGLCQRFLKKYISDNTIDVIINQWWPAATTKDTNAKVVKCLHMCLFMNSAYENLEWRGMGILKKLLGKHVYMYLHKTSRCRQVEEYLPYVDKYVFLSPRFRDEYLEFRHQANSEKLDYCYNPIVIKSPNTTEIYNKKKKVLFVGRMYDIHKRVSLILDIWREIEKDSKFNEWSLDLVGDGPDKAKFEQRAKELGLKNVTFHGYCRPEPYYQQSSIFLMTSRFEGWGMTLVESQINGVVPVVYDTFSSVHDIITNGENGFVVENGNKVAFVENLKLLMRDDKLRSKMAIEGMSTSRRFSVENVVDRWVAIFNSLTK